MLELLGSLSPYSQKNLALNKVTCNSKISLLYDSLRELLEALALKSGFKIYNHECFTYFLKEVLKEGSKADEFDELRKIRNSINYYGKSFDLEDTKLILNSFRGDIPRCSASEIFNRLEN